MASTTETKKLTKYNGQKESKRKRLVIKLKEKDEKKNVYIMFDTQTCDSFICYCYYRYYYFTAFRITNDILKKKKFISQ